MNAARTLWKDLLPADAEVDTPLAADKKSH